MRGVGIAIVAALALAGPAAPAETVPEHGPVSGSISGRAMLALPAGVQPRQSLHVEALGGRQPFLVALGNAAFSAPALLGERARAAGVSCNTCHVNGHRNAGLFVPGQSTVPGTFDPGGPAFAAHGERPGPPRRIPTLRGVRFTAPYGHDGRSPTLHDFTRFAIVREFDGPEPPALILDALVAYMEEFDWLPAPRLSGSGVLRDASPAEARGAAAFAERCAACHVPATGFTDRRLHDVGTGGDMDTPSLRGAAFNAPYLHDGSAPTLEAAVERHAPPWSDDLAAYLAAIGDGELPEVPVTFRAEMAELSSYVDAIGGALSRGETAAAVLVAGTVAGELDRLAGLFPYGDPAAERREPVDYAGLTGRLRSIARAAAASDIPAAEAALAGYLAEAESVAGRYAARLR